MKVQVLYNIREATGFCSEQNLADFFKKSFDPSPSFGEEIKDEVAMDFIARCILAYGWPHQPWYNCRYAFTSCHATLAGRELITIPTGHIAVPYEDVGYQGGQYWAILPEDWTIDEAALLYYMSQPLTTLDNIAGVRPSVTISDWAFYVARELANRPAI